MSTLLRRTVSDLDLLRQGMDRLLSDSVASRDEAPASAPSWAPRADVVETPDAFHLVLDVPGVSLDKLDVNVENGTLAVSGERAVASAHSDARFHRVERSYGRFFRSFTLGTDIDADRIDASVTDGELTVVVPKAEARKPRQIAVRTTERAAERTEDAEVVSA
jgi:HSP20 family protein